jgi:hypothetical protein
VDQFAEQDAIGDPDAVATEPIVDHDDGDNSVPMNIDLSGDSALSVREKTLIQNMRRALRNIRLNVCTNAEDATPIDIKMESCGRMRTTLTRVRSYILRTSASLTLLQLPNRPV